MRLNKTQTAVIVLLNLLIAALVAYIFLSPYFIKSGGGQGGAPSDDDPPNQGVNTDPGTPPHNKLRDASAGKTPEVLRETRLMGTGDERAVSVFFKDGVTYIFGNAGVGDLDFDSYGGFLCTVNGAGTILGFTYFDGTITAAATVGNGFAVTAERGAGTSDATSRLYFVDYEGVSREVATLDGTPRDVFAIDNKKIAVVTQPTSASLKFSEYETGESEYSLGRSTRIECWYNLTYFDCYDLGGSYVISARAHSLPLYDSVVFFEFAPGGSETAHYYGGSNDAKIRPYAVMPFGGGYFALADKGGLATLVSVDYSFKSYHSASLDFTFTNASLGFVGGKYYACFDRADGAITYELDENLNRRRLDGLGGMVVQCAADAGETALLGVKGEYKDGKRDINSLQVYMQKSEKSLVLDVLDGEVYGACKATDGLTLVIGARGGSALSSPSGGSDLYVLTVNI